jgi:hypothetical protein
MTAEVCKRRRSYTDAPFPQIFLALLHCPAAQFLTSPSRLLKVAPRITNNRKEDMKLKIVILITAFCVIAGYSGAQSKSADSSGAPYTEGPVWDITMVKTKSGLGDDYLKSLAQTFKGVMEEQKKQGIVMDYKVLLGDSSNRDDFNILLMVEFKNMAAFDGLREKTDPIMNKVMGSEDAQRQLSVKRLDVREILGTKTMREVTLK